MKDMKGVLFVKVLKAKQNATKKDEEDASQATASSAYQNDEFLNIIQPITKIVYLDQEVTSHNDESAFNPMDVDDEVLIPGIFAFKIQNDGSVDKKMEIELYDGDELHGIAT